jgi:SAM-dependent methyltransferase
MNPEASSIAARYARRAAKRDAELYHPLSPTVLMSTQERERALHQWLRDWGPPAVRDLRVLEIGCGTGRTLLDLLRLGFQPENMTGNDLLPDRLETARAILPSGVRLIPGDAMDAPFDPNSFDVVLQSTVFTSIIDSQFQVALAARMWNWVSEAGGVLWYDFVYNNPSNQDVKGVPLRHVRELFPNGVMTYSRHITLAPPISRRVTRVHPHFYTLFNLLPLLRTHVLCWIEKRDPSAR